MQDVLPVVKHSDKPLQQPGRVRGCRTDPGCVQSYDNCTSRLILCRNILGNILQSLTLYVQMHEAPGTAEGFFFILLSHFSITADTTVILRLFSVAGGTFPARRFTVPSSR